MDCGPYHWTAQGPSWFYIFYILYTVKLPPARVVGGAYEAGGETVVEPFAAPRSSYSACLCVSLREISPAFKLAGAVKNIQNSPVLLHLCMRLLL